MKNFIYLDTDYLTSALSQINNGKIKEVTEGTNIETQKQTAEIEPSEKTNANFQIGFSPIIKASFGSSSADTELEHRLSHSDSVQKMITKSFDDNMYDVFTTYLQENKMLKDSGMNIGSFFYSNSDYKLIDLEFILSLLSDEFIELYVDEKKITEQFLDQIKSGNREEKRRLEGEAKKQAKEDIKFQKENFRNIKNYIKTIITAMPSPILLITENMILPIKRNFLRGDYKDISFKYQDKISLLAQSTRRLNNDTQPVGTDLVLRAVDVFLPLVLKMFQIPTDENTLVAIPIGIYVE